MPSIHHPLCLTFLCGFAAFPASGCATTYFWSQWAFTQPPYSVSRPLVQPDGTIRIKYEFTKEAAMGHALHGWGIITITPADVSKLQRSRLSDSSAGVDRTLVLTPNYVRRRMREFEAGPNPKREAALADAQWIAEAAVSNNPPGVEFPLVDAHGERWIVRFDLPDSSPKTVGKTVLYVLATPPLLALDIVLSPFQLIAMPFFL